MNSRERMLATLWGQEPDHVPLCFMIFAALRDQCADLLEYAGKQLELGVDATVELPLSPLRASHDYMDAPGLPVRYDPRVKISESRREDPAERYPLLQKEYETPGGTLDTVVQQTEDWPYGDHVPFLDDHLVPRSRKFLIERRDDLRPLRHLLTPVAEADLVEFREGARRAREFAQRHDLLVRGGRGLGMELAPFLMGMENMLLCALEDEEFVAELAEMIFEWNRERMMIFLDEELDLFVRSGWYESTDLWSPRLFSRFILPWVRKEAELAHQAGTLYGHIMTSGQMPLLDLLMDAGVDVLIGIDPVQGKGMDLAALKEKTAGRMCVWGGVNGFVTMEQGSENQVRQEVREALGILGQEVASSCRRWTMCATHRRGRGGTCMP